MYVIIEDVEDQAAKISVEEQMLITTIQTLQKDLDSGLSDCSFKLSFIPYSH